MALFPSGCPAVALFPARNLPLQISVQETKRGEAGAGSRASRASTERTPALGAPHFAFPNRTENIWGREGEKSKITPEALPARWGRSRDCFCFKPSVFVAQQPSLITPGALYGSALPRAQVGKLRQEEGWQGAGAAPGARGMLPAPAQLRPQLPALGGAAGRCPRPQMWPPVPRPPSRTITALPTPPWRWCPTEVLDFGRTRTFPLPKSLNLYLYRRFPSPRALGVSGRAGPSWGGLVLGPAGRTCWQPPRLWLSPGELCHQNFPRVSPWFLPSWVNREEIRGGFGSEVAPLALMRSGTFGLTLESARLGFASQSSPKSGVLRGCPGGLLRPCSNFEGSRAGRGCNAEQFWQAKPKESCHKPTPRCCCCPKTNPRGAQEGSPVPGCSPPAPLAPSPVRLEQENQIMSCM